MNDMAEREGFEPSVGLTTHAFQACALNHSAISPTAYLQRLTLQKRPTHEHSDTATWSWLHEKKQPEGNVSLAEDASLQSCPLRGIGEVIRTTPGRGQAHSPLPPRPRVFRPPTCDWSTSHAMPGSKPPTPPPSLKAIWPRSPHVHTPDRKTQRPATVEVLKSTGPEHRTKQHSVIQHCLPSSATTPAGHGVLGMSQCCAPAQIPSGFRGSSRKGLPATPGFGFPTDY